MYGKNMKINYKSILIAMIVNSCYNFTCAAEKNQLREYVYNDTKIKPIDYLVIKTAISESNNQSNTIENTKFTSSQLLSRIIEKTEYKDIKTLAGQSIDNIIQEIGKINDNDLTNNNIDKFSMGTLYFIATGGLTYGEITPDKAMEKYNEKVQKYNESNTDNSLQILENEKVQEARQNDINEIEARETLQALEKEYKEIIERDEQNLDQSTGEIIQIFVEALNTATDNKLRNSLVDLLSNQDSSEDIEIIPPSKEEIAELKKIIEERKILPKDKPVIFNKIKAIGNKIKNWFTKRSNNNKTHISKEENNNISEKNKITTDKSNNNEAKKEQSSINVDNNHKNESSNINNNEDKIKNEDILVENREPDSILVTDSSKDEINNSNNILSDNTNDSNTDLKQSTNEDESVKVEKVTESEEVQSNKFEPRSGTKNEEQNADDTEGVNALQHATFVKGPDDDKIDANLKQIVDALNAM